MKNLFILLLIGLFSNFSLTAQNMIEGGISNELGEVLTTATITLENEEDDHLNKTIQTDEYGYFIMEGLVDGSYRLIVEHTTYKTISMDNFEFPRDTDQILGLTMEPLNDAAPTIVKNSPDNNNSIAKLYK